MIPYLVEQLRPISEAKTADLRHIPTALVRAAQHAQALAKHTNTHLVVHRNGQLLQLKVN